MTLIDTHAHLSDERFATDLPEVLRRAEVAGVTRILAVGIDLETSRACVALAKQYPLLRAAVGIQPNHAHADAWGDARKIQELAGEACVAAIGETGLDRYWDRCPFDVQEWFFAWHLELARNLGKPVIVHCREAEADVVRMLRAEFDRSGPLLGVMHSYTGDAAHAAICVELGMYISFAGMLTYKTAADLRAVAATIPADRLLVETDCPYLAPVPVRGKRNEPAYVSHTAAVLAEVRGETPARMAEQTTANARALFGL